jgi:hypothetical protein
MKCDYCNWEQGNENDPKVHHQDCPVSQKVGNPHEKVIPRDNLSLWKRGLEDGQIGTKRKEKNRFYELGYCIGLEESLL